MSGNVDTNGLNEHLSHSDCVKGISLVTMPFSIRCDTTTNLNDMHDFFFPPRYLGCSSKGLNCASYFIQIILLSIRKYNLTWNWGSNRCIIHNHLHIKNIIKVVHAFHNQQPFAHPNIMVSFWIILYRVDNRREQLLKLTVYDCEKQT